MDLRHLHFVEELLGKQSQKGLDPLMSELRVYKVLHSEREIRSLGIHSGDRLA